MAKRKFMAGVLAAVMLLALVPVTIASASEVVLFEHTFNNNYTNDNLAYNWWGQHEKDANYMAGKIWAVPWGGYGNLRDAEDGSLAVIRGFKENGEPVSGNETQISKKIVADTIADNSTLEITYDFRTPDSAPQNTGVQVWFRFSSDSPDGVNTLWCPFALKISGGGIEPVWAVTQSYPGGQKNVIGKELDSDPNQIGFEWGKDYSVKITLKPGISGTEDYRYVVEVWEDGSKIGTGVIEQWSIITSDVIKNFESANFNMPTTDPISPGQELEDLLYLKGIKLKAIQPDVKLGAEFFPENNCVDAAADTEVYAEFDSPVNAVSAGQVTVDGGASVADVAMGNDNKRVEITLSGVKADTSYTIKLKNVKSAIAEKAFDYEWSFTTGSGVTFGEPYFGSSTVHMDASKEGVDISNAVAFTSEDYLSGDEWGISDTSNVGTVFEASGKKISVNLPASAVSLKKKISALNDGESLKVSGDITIKHNKASSYANYYKIGLLGATTNLSIMSYKPSNYWRYMTFLHDGDYSLWGNPSNASVVQAVNVSGKGKWLDDGRDREINSETDCIDIGDIPNSGTKSSYFDGTVNVSFVASPSRTENGKYDLSVTLTGDAINATATKTVDKAYVLDIDEFVIYVDSSLGEVDETLKVENLKIETTMGNSYPTVGENSVNIAYNNKVSEPFDADVLVVERDAETGKLVNATIINKEDISDESGIMNCAFSVKGAGSKLDIYVLNDADGMILLSKGTSFTVGE